MSHSPPDASPPELDENMDVGEHDGEENDIVTPLDNSSIPKPKRLACMICRKRKLRCDGIRPSCSTCTRLGHTCAYDEVRRKSGPKRGYVKALEERLKQVETLLKTQDISGNGSATSTAKSPAPAKTNSFGPAEVIAGDKAASPSLFTASKTTPGLGEQTQWPFQPSELTSAAPPLPLDSFDFSTVGGNGVDIPNSFTWEMIGLGLEEPLPPEETIDELHHIYFDKIHPSMPMIQKYRYLAAMKLAPNQRPPVCLRYIMWTLAAAITDKYANLRDLFYQRARKYVENDYIKGFGEHLISVAHAQTHVLLAQYEFKMMYFPRAWMSTGSAVRLSQMMGLHRLDGAGLDVKQCLPPPRDWTEKEERRRTFWMAFTEDRYASIGTGWPMTIDEKDILTNMPASDAAFDMSREEQTVTLGESMSPAGAGQLSSLGGIVLMATLFGRNLVHLHRPDADDRDHDLNGEFWKRHRNMDNILLNTSLCLPQQLKLPQGITNPNTVFTNMCIHTSTICLHQAAIFKADKNRLPSAVSSESKIRCITAANEIASIMRMISHMDLSSMNPFIAFCLYVGARVFVQYLKSRPEDSQTADSLRFLLAAMSALKRRNPLTESFLVQLDVDLEALGTRIPSLRTAFQRHQDTPPTGNSLHNMGGKDHAPTGISAYRNECHFMKVPGDTGDLTNAADLADASLNTQRAAPQMAVQGPWLGSDEAMPLRNSFASTSAYGRTERHTSSASDTGNTSHTTTSGFGQGSSTNDQSTSSAPTPSDRPTPNSMPSDRNGRNERASFQASPVNVNIDSNVNFFGDMPNAYSTGLTPFLQPETPGRPSAGDVNENAANNNSVDGNGNADGTGFQNMDWGDMSMPSNATVPMTPGTEGVLRTIMQMGPMETMDLGWDSNN